MAQIAVERRRGMPWWAWLLIVLAIIGILWWIFAAATPADQAAAPTTAEEQAAREAPVTNLQTVFTAADPEALVGRRAELNNVEVRGLAGDNAFMIGPSPDQQMLVVTSGMQTAPGTTGQQPGTAGQQPGTTGQQPGTTGQQPGATTEPGMEGEAQRQEQQPGTAPGTGALAAHNLQPGDRVNVSGRIERFPGWDEARTRWSLPETERARLENQQVYLEADNLAVMGR